MDGRGANAQTEEGIVLQFRSTAHLKRSSSILKWDYIVVALTVNIGFPLKVRFESFQVYLNTILIRGEGG